jgi:tetratricopeptide (TPR) repeat protein
MESAPETTSTDFDFLNQLTEEPVMQTPESTSSDVDNLGTSEQEQDDSFAWLESLAAKQGANEGLLTKPEDRLEEEPEWVRQAKGLSSAQPPVEPAVTEPSASFEELGKSEQEQDDSFAWLENLAAKQGATEGLLTKPEERMQEEPDWVKQAKTLSAQEPPAPVTPEPQQEVPVAMEETPDWLRNLGEEEPPEPTSAADETAMWLKSLDEATAAAAPSSSSIEELGRSEQEQDDSFAWLESLAAKQGATEGLLTKPEDRLEQEPEWVKQAKDLGAQQPPVQVTPEPAPEPEQPAAMDETAAWLRSLEEEEKQSTSAADETAMWLKSLEEVESQPVQPVESSEEGLPAWMQNIEQEELPAVEATAPASEPQPEAEVKVPAEEPVAMEESKFEEESIPSWLAELDKEEEKPVSVAADEDLPAWLRAEEAAPAAAEPTRPTDWKPVEEKQPEIIYSPPLEETKQPEIIYSPSLVEVKEPEPVAQQPQEQPVEVHEPPKAEPEPTPKPQPYKEPVTRRAPSVSIPTVDSVLGSARNELSRSNIPGALESYAKLIKKGRFLDEVIYDLREALYRYPVEVNIWQSLGDAYMRANRLQDALDAYTKAEELLR